MRPEELLDILDRAARLKTTYRHCYTEGERRESVADHSWRIALMAMLISREPEFADADMDKVIRMCLIHDLGESFTGDVPTFLKTKGDSDKEDDIFRLWVASFPEAQSREWTELLAEMEALETREAKIYKALDRIEALISHNESDLETWEPLEYDLQYTYGKENVKFSEYLTALRNAVDDQTTEKLKREGSGFFGFKNKAGIGGEGAGE
ncbi:MAG: HD domain-containing protein [Lachnospiraceae bacterium]|nr:HD domain-containing protein [Lachnospiraceae bacterium]